MTPATMSPPRWPRRVLVYAIIGLCLHLGGARVLVGLGIVDRLLASAVPLELGLLPLALVFFSVRLLVLFVAPGLCLAALVLGWLWPARPSQSEKT